MKKFESGFSYEITSYPSYSKPNHGYVYFAKINEPYYKIGFTKNPKGRLGTLRRENHKGVFYELLIESRCAPTLEAYIHRDLFGCHLGVSGELFYLREFDFDSYRKKIAALARKENRIYPVDIFDLYFKNIMGGIVK